MKVAVFVDAGYLYGTGCLSKFRTIPPRTRVALDLDAVLRQLKFEVSALDGGGGRLVRIYWYDGAPKAGMTPDQARIASAQDVKLRLGSVNNYGEQKGVDALIAHDLSELARNQAIDAAVLVSGDEDILVGVQTAQSFGVRVHLLGIDPVRSQSVRLMQEADVCREWPTGLVEPWFSLRGPTVRPLSGEEESEAPSALPDMAGVIAAIRDALSGREAAVVENWDRDRFIARDVDSALMRELSAILGRQLPPYQKPALREAFIDALRAELNIAPPQAEGDALGGGDGVETDDAGAALDVSSPAHAAAEELHAEEAASDGQADAQMRATDGEAGAPPISAPTP